VNVLPSDLPESPPAPAKRSGVWSTFQFRNFRLLWIGLLISNVGTWMQLTALGYVVVTTASSEGEGAFRLGLIGISQALPALILSPFAGVLADTVPRKRILLFTNSIVALLALILALLVTAHITALPVLMLVSAASAAARAFDSPARQSWVPVLVDRAHLSNAIGLNSVAFNAPSALGPSVAGFLIASVSVAGSFYANAVCTLAVVVALILMDPSPNVVPKRVNFRTAFWEGVQFLARHRLLRWIVLGLIANSLLVRPYLQLLPAFTINVLHFGPSGLGLLLGASGCGAILGAVTTALLGNVERRARLWAVAGSIVGLCVASMGMLQLASTMCIVLLGAGFSTLIFVGSSNILIQSLSPDDMRGRAVSAFSMIILGLVPLGTLVLGSLARLIGLRASLSLSGLLATVVILGIWFSQEPLREA